jgi:hypothetical protein
MTVQTLNLKFVRESRWARLYENADGARQWVPRSVCPHTLKHPAEDGALPVHEVDIEYWWMQKNPWPKDKQKELI